MLLQRSFTSLCNKLDKRKDEMVLEALHFHQSIQTLGSKTFKTHSLNILLDYIKVVKYIMLKIYTYQLYFSLKYKEPRDLTIVTKKLDQI